MLEISKNFGSDIATTRYGIAVRKGTLRIPTALLQYSRASNVSLRIMILEVPCPTNNKCFGDLSFGYFVV